MGGLNLTEIADRGGRGPQLPERTPRFATGYGPRSAGPALVDAPILERQASERSGKGLEFASPSTVR
jgi:hypothetical protein